MPKPKRKSKIEYKAEAFAKRYVANKMNGTKTVKELYNPSTDGVARKIASETIAKPIFATKIQEAMEAAGLNNDFISKVTKRNAIQEKNYAASNTAIDIYHRIHGNYAPEKKTNINLNITAEQAEQELKDLLNGLTH